MVPAVVLLTTKSIMVLEAYSRECEKCPLESVCWRPKLLEGPISVGDIQLAIDMLTSQLFCLAIKQKVRSLLVFSTEKICYKIFRIPERRMKNILLEELKKLNPSLEVEPDPVFKAFLEHGVRYAEHQIVNVTQDAPTFKPLRFGDVVLADPQFVCVHKEGIDFYRLDLSQWQWIPELEKKGDSNSDSRIARDALKKIEEDKEVLQTCTR